MRHSRNDSSQPVSGEAISEESGRHSSQNPLARARSRCENHDARSTSVAGCTPPSKTPRTKRAMSICSRVSTSPQAMEARPHSTMRISTVHFAFQRCASIAAGTWRIR